MTELAASPQFVEFVDVTGVNSHLVPAVHTLPMVALYATGSDGIQATAAQIARFARVGVPVVLIDQTPQLEVFEAGLAAIADIEAFAGTPADAAESTYGRQLRGLHSTLYCSQSSLGPVGDALRAHGKINLSLVWFGVANYNDSLASAQAALKANPTWAYVQYGDNITNANTLVPGTSVTCGQAQCDIDVANFWWFQLFVPHPPPPPPPPPKGPFRHLTTEGQTLAELAASRRIGTRTLIQHAVDAYTVKDLAALESAKLPAGIPWYTLLP